MTELTAEQNAARSETIAKMNDLARTMGKPCLARAVMTQGIAALPTHELDQIMSEIRCYENWTRGDDTYAERDFGVLTRVTRNSVTKWTQEPQPDPKDGEPRPKKVFFKMDYYHKPTTAAERKLYSLPDEWAIDAEDAITYGSPDPSKASITDRVLTIMLAEEY